MSYIQNPASSATTPFAQVTWTSSSTVTPDTSSQSWCTAGSSTGFSGSGFVAGTVVLSSPGVGSYYIGSSTSRYQFGQMFGRSGSSYGQAYPACEPASVAYGNSTTSLPSSTTGSISVSTDSRINIMRIES